MKVIFLDNNNKEQMWVRVESVKCLSSGRAVIIGDKNISVISVPIENLIEIREA